MADAKAKESPIEYDTVRLIFGNVKNIKMLNTKLAANVKNRLANWGPLALFADIFQVRIRLFVHAVQRVDVGVRFVKCDAESPDCDR